MTMLEPESRSWTTTKIVAVIVAIITVGTCCRGRLLRFAMFRTGVSSGSTCCWAGP